MKRKAKFNARQVAARAAILGVESAVTTFGRTLSRLRGIAAKVTEDETPKALTHRARTIAGYKKTILKNSAALWSLVEYLRDNLESLE